MRGGMTRPAAMGTVLTTDGSTLTISAKQFTKPTTAGATPTSTTVTYTVTTTGATTVTKAGAASTVSAIAVGDTIAVQGTVSGTNVVATTIRDGVMMRGKGANGTGSTNGNIGAGAASLVAGNGQPVVGGAITAISGNTLTVTNKSNVIYTVDATSAKFLQGNTTIALTGLKVGDTVVVQGTVNGTAVTASTVIDQGQPATSAGTTGTAPKKAGIGGFFGGIGSFFSHLFGF
jgi:hypothetical protein